MPTLGSRIGANNSSASRWGTRFSAVSGLRPCRNQAASRRNAGKPSSPAGCPAEIDSVLSDQFQIAPGVKHDFRDVVRVSSHITGCQCGSPGVSNQNYAARVQFLPNRLQIFHGARDGVVAHVWQQCGQAAAGLIVKNYAKAVRCKSAVSELVK